MTDISKEDFRLLGPKILGRVIGVSFLGQWTEDQVYEAFAKYMILIPKGFKVRIKTYWMIKNNQQFLDNKHPLDNQLEESSLGVSGSFQITIAKFISPAEVKRIEDAKKKNRPTANQERSADPGETAHGKGNEAGGKDPAKKQQALPL